MISYAIERSENAETRRNHQGREAEAAVAIARNRAAGHLFPATLRPRSESPFDFEAWIGDNEEGRVEETAMPNLSANHMGTYVPITMGPSDPCPICALPERLLQQGMCGHCGFGTWHVDIAASSSNESEAYIRLIDIGLKTQLQYMFKRPQTGM